MHQSQNQFVCLVARTLRIQWILELIPLMKELVFYQQDAAKDFCIFVCNFLWWNLHYVCQEPIYKLILSNQQTLADLHSILPFHLHLTSLHPEPIVLLYIQFHRTNLSWIKSLSLNSLNISGLSFYTILWFRALSRKSLRWGPYTYIESRSELSLMSVSVKCLSSNKFQSRSLFSINSVSSKYNFIFSVMIDG